MDPVEMQAAQGAVQAPPAAAEQQPAPEPDGDEGDLSKIEIEPAEDGGAIIHHHRHLPDRVKHMEEAKPRKHVVKSHSEMVKHLDKHGKRLKPQR